jgi:hypothetical protein
VGGHRRAADEPETSDGGKAKKDQIRQGKRHRYGAT